ncbi:RNA polymerase sigma factor [Planctomicrobium sp. SH527]|uniref:RNA polymerase sigma factor n=1 Tax=Planctomicrobium sp. SH527 TaxID=3448123 RepID=UPI003F5C786F
MNRPSELAELIDRVRTGDQEAAAILVHQYEPEIRRFIRFRMTSTSVRRFVDSLDICQSVLARFFRSLDSNDIELSDPKQLQALLMQIAQNRIYDVVAWQHARKRDARKLEKNGDEVLTRLAASSSPAERLVEMQELVDQVYLHCSEDDRALIERRMNGAEWKELAEDTGASQDAVRKRVSRALERAALDAGILSHRSPEEE